MAKKTEDTGFSEIDKLLDKEFDDLINLSKVDNKVKNWLSWGNYALNYISSKNLRNGIPCGRITSISGLSSTGKSLLSANVMKDPKIDMILIIETEGSNSQELVEFAGVDPKKVRIIRGSTFKSFKTSKKTGKIEEISDNEIPVNKETDQYIYTEGLTSKLKRFINTIEFNKIKKNIYVVLDSLANVSSVRSLNGTSDMGKKGQDLNNFFQTFDIALERTNIAFLFTNKLYSSMDMYNPYVESGGNSVAYNTSLSIRLSTVSDSDDVSDAELKEEKERRKSALGSSLKIAKAKITKSRFGTEGRNSSFIIDLNYGITKLSGLFNLLFDFGVITSPSSGWYECPCITKDKFRKKDFIDMVSKNEDKYIDIFQKELEKAEEKIKQNKIEKLESGKIDVSDDEKIEVSGEEIDDFSAIAMEREMMREADK